jgi:16S rRNA (cytosine1402-N4)-methyltransferase
MSQPSAKPPGGTEAAAHVPVLADAALFWLDPRPGQTVVDATLGGGGHAARIAEHLGPAGRLIGLDQDPEMVAKARARLSRLEKPPTLDLVATNFASLRRVLDELRIDRVSGVLADLGFAADQVADARRGFSFQHEGPLDMRLDPRQGETAADLVATRSEKELADIFFHLGQERYSRRVAQRIVEARSRQPIATTTRLAELVRRCVPRSRGLKIDPATRVFQALRIAVNDELGALARLLADLPLCLSPNGRAVFISFHSLEDRLVKQAFRDRDRWEALTKKPVVADEAERAANPRARSAKLRAARLRHA